MRRPKTRTHGVSGRYFGAAALAAFTLSVACQCVAFGVNVALGQLLLRKYLPPDLLTGDRDWMMVTVALHAAVAYICARIARLPTAWRIANLLVAPLTVLSIEFSVPSWVMLTALAVLVAIYIPTFWTHVPYYPTDNALYRALLEQLPNDESLTFVDLGCGFGRLLGFLARERPQGRFVGVEVGPLPLLVSKLRARFAPHKNITVRAGSIWKHPCAGYTIAYAFLSPEPMAALWKKLADEMPRGSIFISNSFPVPGVKSGATIEAGRDQRLHVYRIG